MITSPPTAAPFRHGDRWAVIGDSIAQDGLWHTWVALYYLTRFPGQRIDIFNCGISGDSAAGVLRRYEWDIAPVKPTVATIMLGMNDVDRDLYVHPALVSETTISIRRAAALDSYRKNMTSLIARLQADGTRVVLMTPSIFDETMCNELSNRPGVNSQALDACARFARETARNSGGKIGLAEIHAPMSTINRRLQQNDPAFTLTGPDRVHPGPPGHFVIASCFLKAQGLPSDVSSVDIDASSNPPRIIETRNATVTHLVRHASSTTGANHSLSFTLHSAALPFPVPPEATPALDWTDFTENFNREMLTIAGLAPGLYILLIDGITVRDEPWDADEFTKGINLAVESHTPQAQQAAHVAELLLQWRTLHNDGNRCLAQTEHWHIQDWPHPVSLDDAVRSRLMALIQQWNSSVNPIDHYHRDIVQRYLSMKPLDEENHNRLHALSAVILKKIIPKKHHYEVRKLA